MGVCVLDVRYSKFNLGGAIVELSGSLGLLQSFNGMLVQVISCLFVHSRSTVCFRDSEMRSLSFAASIEDVRAESMGQVCMISS
jgi:hypothetical protein